MIPAEPAGEPYEIVEVLHPAGWHGFAACTTTKRVYYGPPEKRDATMTSTPVRRKRWVFRGWRPRSQKLRETMLESGLQPGAAMRRVG